MDLFKQHTTAALAPSYRRTQVTEALSGHSSSRTATHPGMSPRLRWWQGEAQRWRQQIDWEDVGMWLRGQASSALLCFENAEHAVRRGGTQVGFLLRP